MSKYEKRQAALKAKLDDAVYERNYRAYGVIINNDKILTSNPNMRRFKRHTGSKWGRR